jgi:paired amphipathic helix protein Sin3a
MSRSHTPHTLPLHGQQPPFDPSFSPGFPNPQTTAAASVLGNLNNNNRNAVDRQPPGEFNHAIHYLNKIKARYADDANTYKQFLDILQTYQKEQRHLHDVSGLNMVRCWILTDHVGAVPSVCTSSTFIQRCPGSVGGV